MASEKQVVVRGVWEENLEAEFSLIKKIIKQYPYASMDTEFPGVIHPPPHPHYQHKLSPREAYRFMKMNVNNTKLIQLGLTLSDAKGNLPDFKTPVSFIWEFNFREFDIDDKEHQNEISIELLKRQGIDFLKNREEGIDSNHFAKLFKDSGLNCAFAATTNPPPGFTSKEKVTWVTFHSSYDFGHLVKILNQKDLPDDLLEFMEDVKKYFGVTVYDMKHIIKFCGLYGGLEKIARSLQVDRVAGKSHQAGSDSLLTMHTFMKLRDTYLNETKLDWFNCKLFGLEVM